jgi:uncharacterized repeat protein (TIGR01451 family)
MLSLLFVVLHLGMPKSQAGPAEEAAAQPSPDAQSAEVSQLIKDLGDDSFSVREKANKQLVKLGVASLPAIRQAASSEDAEVRSRAWRLIDHWADQGEMPAILVQLEPTNGVAYRLQAMNSLGKLGPKAKVALPALTLALCDESALVRQTAGEVINAIQTMPALEIAIHTGNDPVRVGKETVYDIQVTNQGTSPATNLAILTRLPSQLEVTKVEGPTQHCQNGQQLIFEPLVLQPKNTLHYLVHVKAAHSGRARLEVEMSTEGLAYSICETRNTTILKR